MSGTTARTGPTVLSQEDLKGLLGAVATIEERSFAHLKDREGFSAWILGDTAPAGTGKGADKGGQFERPELLPAHAVAAIDMAYLASGLLLSDNDVAERLPKGRLPSRKVPDWLLDVLKKLCQTEIGQTFDSYPFLPERDDGSLRRESAGANYEALSWFAAMCADLAERVNEALKAALLDKALGVVTKACARDPLYFGLAASEDWRECRGPFKTQDARAALTADPNGRPGEAALLTTIGLQAIGVAIRVLAAVIGETAEGAEAVGELKTTFLENAFKTATMGNDKWQYPEGGPDVDATRRDVADATQLAWLLQFGASLDEKAPGHHLDGESPFALARRISDTLWSKGVLESLMQPVVIRFPMVLGKGSEVVTYRRDYLLPLYVRLETELAASIIERGVARDDALERLTRAWKCIKVLMPFLEGEASDGEQKRFETEGLLRGPLSLVAEKPASADAASFNALARARAIVFTATVQDALSFFLFVVLKNDLVEKPVVGEESAEGSTEMDGSVMAFKRSFKDLVRSTLRELEQERKHGDDESPETELESRVTVRNASTPFSKILSDYQALLYLACIYLEYVFGTKSTMSEKELDVRIGNRVGQGLLLITPLIWETGANEISAVMVAAFVARWHGRKLEEDERTADSTKPRPQPRELFEKGQFSRREGVGYKALERTGKESVQREDVDFTVVTRQWDSWVGFLQWVSGGCSVSGGN